MCELNVKKPRKAKSDIVAWKVLRLYTAYLSDDGEWKDCVELASLFNPYAFANDINKAVVVKKNGYKTGFCCFRTKKDAQWLLDGLKKY